MNALFNKYLNRDITEALEAVISYYGGFKDDPKYTVEEKNLPRNILGQCDRERKKIYINDTHRWEYDQRVRTLTHEFVHAMGCDDEDKCNNIAELYFPMYGSIREYRADYIEKEGGDHETNWPYLVEAYGKKKVMGKELTRSITQEIAEHLKIWGWDISEWEDSGGKGKIYPPKKRDF